MCHFRKVFQTSAPEQVVMTIAADDQYDLFVNGHAVKSGAGSRQQERLDVSRYIKQGTNVIAVRVSNRNGNTAGLAAQLTVKDKGATRSIVSDQSWKYNLRPFPLWNSPLYNDRGWKTAQTMGALKAVEPTPALAPQVAGKPAPTRASSVAQPTPAASSAKDDAPIRAQSIAATKGSTPTATNAAREQSHERFTLPEDFQLSEILDSKTAGSLIALTFNEFGHLVVSRETEGLFLVFDKDNDGKFETVRPYCDKVKNCQGLLCLNGEVFATGDGPEGAALYRLSDNNEDGTLETVQAVLKFRGEMGEHGPHGLVLGPDGMLYVIVGNHSAPVKEYEAKSPHRNFYEGDLVGPRYEDPGGHANGVKAPGGVVIRTDIAGKHVSLVAGGLRNPYDLAFNREGELFVHDSDMEADLETTWYRPTRLYHITPGGEFGWRSGWAKWPDYYVDNLPAVVDTGRGSPTGAVVYNHHTFPARYHNAVFLADWSEGRILVATLSRNGASYKSTVENFVEGRPLNVTDLEVGPDGNLYFCTGGRGTEGGIYRVAWKGKIPPNVQNLGEGIEAVIRQPQFHAAWSRQEVARRRREMGDQWDRLVKGVARSKSNPWQYRLRALDLMTLYGPRADAAFLITLSKDADAEIRAKAAEMLALHDQNDAQQRLEDLLTDENARVRRKAAESLTALQHPVSFEALEPMLASEDRREAWAARRLLEHTDPATYRVQLADTENPRLFIQGATALLVAHPSKENAEEVIRTTLRFLEGYVSDPDFIDLLRVTQLALIRGGFSAADAPDVRQALEREFPANHAIMNRELIRLLAYLDAATILDRYLAYLRSDAEQVDKLHVAFHLRFIKSGWTHEQRMELVKFFENAVTLKGGNSYERYVQNIAGDFARGFDVDDSLALLAQGDQYPTSAVGALYNVPEKLDDATRSLLIDLDERLAVREGASVDRLKIGLVAVLARSGDADSMAHLRDVWDRDPERRSMIAMGLAQQPGGANWEYLLRSLPILDGDPARVVLTMLRDVPYGPSDPEHYRQAILCGLRLGESGSTEALALLEYWTSGAIKLEGATTEESLQAWQTWFEENYPDHPPAELPTSSPDSKHQLQDLLEFINKEGLEEASAARGELVFTKAQCVKCHRSGAVGASAGPDLTSIGKRFTKREILESILFPSHVISDQYATKSIVTTGGRTFTGMVGVGGADEVTILQEDGRTVTVAKDQVDEMHAVKKSAMPEGLMNELEQQEVADLIEFLIKAPATSIASPTSPTTVR
jgi:putative heme-binding domain-containing protein